MKRRKLTVRIRRDTRAALATLGKEFIRTWKTGKSPGDTLDFESPAILFRVLTPKRWELIEQLQGLGPCSVRALARTLGRDVKRVHTDVVWLSGLTTVRFGCRTTSSMPILICGRWRKLLPVRNTSWKRLPQYIRSDAPGTVHASRTVTGTARHLHPSGHVHSAYGSSGTLSGAKRFPLSSRHS